VEDGIVLLKVCVRMYFISIVHISDTTALCRSFNPRSGVPGNTCEWTCRCQCQGCWSIFTVLFISCTSSHQSVLHWMGAL